MLVEKLVHQSAEGDRGALLVFLPGWDSITTLKARLGKRGGLAGRIQLHTLHSQVPRDEQKAAFVQAPPPLVKVILATNIAETSLTISDVVYVIDSCRIKQLIGMQSHGGRTAYRLMNMAASKQNLTQRAGRAGRVREGVCYRLCTRSTYEQLPETLLPEMVRLPLHQVALTLKSLSLGDATEFLSLTPDPPPLKSVKIAIQVLKDLKALDAEERITRLGTQLAKMPMEPRLGFALLTACMLGLGEPFAALCALSAAPPPYIGDHSRKSSNTWRCWCPSSSNMLSDHYDLLMMYYWIKEMPEEQARAACMQNWLEHRVLKQVIEVTDQTLQILQQMGFTTESALTPCHAWLSQLNTKDETSDHRCLWAMMTFLLGLGLEHFGLRHDARRVWLNLNSTSNIGLSPAIPESPEADPLRPFIIFGELRENQWNSSCRGATAAGAIATLLGAARDLCWEGHRGCVMMDGWAPVTMSPQTASMLGSVRLALRVSILELAGDPSNMKNLTLIPTLTGLLSHLCDPEHSSAKDSS